MFAVYPWHSEAWTPRHEALMEEVVKQARTARHPWLFACDGNMKSRRLPEQLMVQKHGHVHWCARRRTSHLPIQTSKSHEHGTGGRLRIKTAQGANFLGGTRQGDSGIVRFEDTKGLATIQRWKNDRKKQR